MATLIASSSGNVCYALKLCVCCRPADQATSILEEADHALDGLFLQSSQNFLRAVAHLDKMILPVDSTHETTFLFICIFSLRLKSSVGSARI